MNADLRQWIAATVADVTRPREPVRVWRSGPPERPPVCDAYGHRLEPLEHAFFPKGPPRHDPKPLVDRTGVPVREPRRSSHPDESEVHYCDGCGCISAYDQYEYVDVGVGIMSGTTGTRCEVCEQAWHDAGCPRPGTPTWEEGPPRFVEILDPKGQRLALVDRDATEVAIQEGGRKHYEEVAATARAENLWIVNLAGDTFDRVTFRQLKEYPAYFEELCAPLRTSA